MKDLLRNSLKDSTLKVVAIDPGETTGACCFLGSKLEDACQLPTGRMPSAAQTVFHYIQGHSPDVVVMEDYRVYKWKTDSHAWQELHTPKLIGAIEYICGGYIYTVPLVKQTAQQGKGFCTDDKLRLWGVYQEGKQHARDAIRHALYYLLFTHAGIHQQKSPSTNVAKR